MKTNTFYSGILFFFFAFISLFSSGQQTAQSGTAKGNMLQTRNSNPSPVQTLAVTTLMNYQAVARNAAGAILANQTVGLRLTVEDGPGGTVLYSERQTPTTNQFGLLTIKLGNGSVLSGTWSGVNWSAGNQWLKVDMDPTGGSSYTNMGESEMLAVPFANVAGTSADNHWTANGGDIYNNNAGGVAIGTNAATNLLTINSPLYWAATQYTTGATGNTGSDGFYVGINSNIGDAAIWNFENQPVFFGTNSNERMRITGAGNLGIGTSTPNHFVEIAPGGISQNDNEGAGTVYTYGGSLGNALYAESNDAGDQSGTTVYAQAQLAGWNSNNPLGAGNSGVWGNVTGSGDDGYGIVGSFGLLSGAPITYAGLGGPYYAGFFGGRTYVSYDPQGQTDNALKIDNVSSSTLWLPSLQFKNLYGTGDSVLMFGSGASSQGILIVDGAGSAYAPISASAFNTVSDITMKKNITHLGAAELNACLEQIRNIDPITYWYQSENVGTDGNRGNNRQYPHVGFSAQSLPPTVTTMMSAHPGTTLPAEKLGYNLSDMIGLSVLGIKAIDNKQTELEKEIADLKAEIERLKSGR